jgi:hypothetical protein
MVRKITFLALLLLLGAVFMPSCKKEVLSSSKEITSFIFDASENAELERNFLGNISGTNISVEVAFAVNITQLKPTIEISPGASLSPESGQLRDFSGPVVYMVTAEDGTTKSYTVAVSNAPAPYIGKWRSSLIDFGLGLMRVNAEISQGGQITLEFVKVMSGEVDGSSLKGYFEPASRPDTEIKVEQTHRWMNGDWNSESCCRTIMYHMNTPQSMTLYYCLCNPRADWYFQVNLTKQ